MYSVELHVKIRRAGDGEREVARYFVMRRKSESVSPKLALFTGILSHPESRQTYSC